MARLLNLLTAGRATGAESDARDGGFLPLDLTKLSLEQLMNLSVRARGPRDPEEALDNPQNGENGDDSGSRGLGARLKDLPSDLTTLSLFELMNLRVRAPKIEEEPEPDEDEESEPVPEQVAAEEADDAADADADPVPNVDEAPATPAAAHGGGADFAVFEAQTLLEGAHDALPDYLLLNDEDEETGAPGRFDQGVATRHFAPKVDAVAPDLADGGAVETAQAPAAPPDVVLTGGPGNDDLQGGAGHDMLFGQGGKDVLHGSGGDDSLYGEAGDDHLFGDEGDDWLDGGADSDQLRGGAGDDVLVWDSLDQRVDGGDGLDTLVADDENIDLGAFGGQISNIEAVSLNGAGPGSSLALSASDVLDMTDNGNVLTVHGEGGGTLDAGTGWALGGVDAGGYQIYTQTIGPKTATLLVDPDVTVNGDIV